MQGKDNYSNARSHIAPNIDVSGIVVKPPSPIILSHSHLKQDVTSQDISSASPADTKTKVFLSYHREQETGDLIETRVSSNRNHVTARSVNSPHDVFTAFRQDLNKHKSASNAPIGYEYTQPSLRTAESYSPSSSFTKQHSSSGAGILHHTRENTLSEQVSFDSETHRNNHRPVGSKYHYREPHPFETDHLRGDLSPPSSHRAWRMTIHRQDNDGSSAHMLPPTYRTISDTNSKEGKLSQNVKLLPNIFTERMQGEFDSSWRGRGDSNVIYQSSEVDDYRGRKFQGPINRHNSSPVFLTAPLNITSQLQEENVHRRLGRERTPKSIRYLLPRSHSLDSSRRVYLPPEYPNVPPNRSYQEYDTWDNDDALYVGENGQLYVKDKRDYMRYDKNRVRYPHVQPYSDTEVMNSLDDLDSVSISDEQFYIVGKQKAKGHGRSKVRGNRISKVTTHSKRDVLQVPVYTHKRHRGTLSVLSKGYERSREKKGHHSKRVSPSSLSQSDDLYVTDEDGDYYDSGKRTSASTSRSQLRQRKPNLFSENRENVSTINVTSSNERDPTSYNLGLSPNTYNPNFALFPYPGFPSSMPNLYMGMPYSGTSGHLDQLVRSNSLTYPTMRSYLDAMSTSLANIPASTIGTSPYMSQQLLQQYSSDPSESLKTSDFFQEINPPYNGTKLSDVTVLQTNGSQLPSYQQQVSADISYTFPNSATAAGNWPSPRESNVHTDVTYNIQQDRAQEIISPGICPTDVTDLNNSIPKGNVITGDPGLNNAKHTQNDHGPNGVNSAHITTPGNLIDAVRGKINFGQSQSSDESKSQPLSPGKQSGTKLKNTSVQTDCERNKSQPVTTALLQTPPTLPDHSPSVSQVKAFILQKSVSKDSQTQTPKSPPPATLPKYKSATERLISIEPPTPSRHVSSSAPFNHSSNISPAEDINDSHNDDISRQLGSNFFAISNLTVRDKAGHTDNDVRQGVNGHTAKGKMAVTSIVGAQLGQRYSITQISCPDLTNRPTDAHPEADYDIYPRKPITTNVSTDTVDGRQEKGNQFQVTPMSLRSIRTQLPIPLRRYSITLLPQANHFTRNSLEHSPQEPNRSNVSISELQKSSPEVLKSPRQYLKSYTTPLQFQNQKSNDFQSAPEFRTFSRLVSEPEIRTPGAKEGAEKSPWHIPRVINKSLLHSRSYHGNILPQNSQKIEEADTDYRHMPYQFYKGDQSLLTPSANNNRPFPSLTHQSTSNNETRSDYETKSVCAESMLNKINEFDGDSSNTGYIFYKGPNLITVVPNDATIPAFDQPKATPFNAITEHTTDGAGVSVAKVDNASQDVDDVPFHEIIKSEVPIPPRDFDSDADNSDYIYTSKGWSHMLDAQSIGTAMFCTGVQDNSARYLEQLYRLKNEDPNESIIQTFFRKYLPNYNSSSSLPNNNINKNLPLFGGPSWEKLSTSTLSLKWNSDTEIGHTPYVTTASLFGVVTQPRRPSHQSADLDSGVSLASLNSRASLWNLGYDDSDAGFLPGADYSSSNSNTTYSSMELGWDYLSCMESVKEKRRSEGICEGV